MLLYLAVILSTAIILNIGISFIFYDDENVGEFVLVYNGISYMTSNIVRVYLENNYIENLIITIIHGDLLLGFVDVYYDKYSLPTNYKPNSSVNETGYINFISKNSINNCKNSINNCKILINYEDRNKNIYHQTLEIKNNGLNGNVEISKRKKYIIKSIKNKFNL